MLATAISSNPYASSNIQSILPHNNIRIRQNIGKLGDDLQSGDLSAAQQDFATLQQTNPQSSTTSSQSNNPITQAFNQLSVDLQSGNLSGAQQAYSNIQQNFQTQGQAEQTQSHFHHHHHSRGDGTAASQLLDQLGQDSQTSSLVQQTYSSVLQDLSFGQTAIQPQGSNSNGVSLSA
jgi:hypothetical protein